MKMKQYQWSKTYKNGGKLTVRIKVMQSKIGWAIVAGVACLVVAAVCYWLWG